MIPKASKEKWKKDTHWKKDKEKNPNNKGQKPMKNKEQKRTNTSPELL